MPTNPADWAWLVSGWFVLKIADTVVEDAVADVYDKIKAAIGNIRAENPEARVKVDDPRLAEVADDPYPTS